MFNLIKSDDKVQEYYEDITNFMDQIDSKITEIVQGHEKDFLVAFRSIMNQVHEEMKKLREISDEQALLAKRNSALDDLKSALSWFQNEAVKLSQACSDIQEKYDLHKQKIHALETENAHLEKLVSVYSEENERLKENFFSKNFENFENFLENQESTKQKNLDEIISFYQLENTQLLESFKKFLEEKEEIAKKAIFHKQNLKKNQVLKLKIAKENQAKIVCEQNELEKLFCECVNTVTNEAFRRRNKQTVSKHGTKEKFILTAADKRKILEGFITNSQVYTLLAEKLFPNDLSKVVKLQEALASEHHQTGENESIDSLFKHQNDSENSENFANGERLFEPNV